MIISLSFSSKFLTGYSKSYLEEFIRFSQNKVAEIYPDCQLKIRSLGQIYVSSVNLSELTYIAYPAMEEPIRTICNTIGRLLPQLWEQFVKENPSDSASVHACAK